MGPAANTLWVAEQQTFTSLQHAMAALTGGGPFQITKIPGVMNSTNYKTLRMKFFQQGDSTGG